jgi:indole-3-glycerol phosphate synthase
MSVLAEILASKAREIDALRAGAHADAPFGGRVAIDVVGALRARGEMRLIAEVKRKSPSAGVLSRVLDAPSRAEAYARAGAAMVSVLCDGPYFDGGWSDLAAARARVTIPLLAKEFVLDATQIACARRHGADAVLLIARIVDGARLAELAACARDHAIEPLVEVVDEREVDAALRAGARVVGVNARDLDTLVMDAARAARVLAAIPSDVVAVHLSGLRSAADVEAIARGRADAALVGEILMREDDPTALLRQFVRSARR